MRLEQPVSADASRSSGGVRRSLMG